MLTTEEKRKELAHIRRLNAAPPATFTPKPIPHKKAEVLLAEGVLLDPDRAVLSHWKSTPYDGRSRFINHVQTVKGEMLDIGDGPGISDDTGGPFKLRVLAKMGGGRPGLGSVIEVSAVEYVKLRSEQLDAESCPGNRPRFEPVPDNTELRGPILPPNFPSHFPKARSMAAKGLEKSEADLKFSEIVAFFRKGKPQLQTFKG